jgi:hypothetical protein
MVADVKSTGWTSSMKFKVIAEITNVQVIAMGRGVDIRHELKRKYGAGNWRKLKGIATVEYENGQIWKVELHWYEAHGIGRKRMKDKYRLERVA